MATVSEKLMYEHYNFHTPETIDTVQSWLHSDSYTPLALRGVDGVGKEYVLEAASYNQTLEQRAFIVVTVDNNLMDIGIHSTIQQIESQHSFQKKENKAWEKLKSLAETTDVHANEISEANIAFTLKLAATLKLFDEFSNIVEKIKGKQVDLPEDDSKTQLQTLFEIAAKKYNVVIHLRNIETDIHTIPLWLDIVETLHFSTVQDNTHGRVLLAFSLSQYAPYVGVINRDKENITLVDINSYNFIELKQLLDKRYPNNNFTDSFLNLVLSQGSFDTENHCIFSSQLSRAFHKLEEQKILQNLNNKWILDYEVAAKINSVLGMPLREYYQERFETIPQELQPIVKQYMFLASLCGEWIPQQLLLEAMDILEEEMVDDVLDAIEAAFIECSLPLLEDHAYTHPCFSSIAVYKLKYPLLRIKIRQNYSLSSEQLQKRAKNLLDKFKTAILLENQAIANLFWNIALHSNLKTKNDWKIELDWHVNSRAMPYFKKWLYEKTKTGQDHKGLMLQVANEPLSPTIGDYLDLVVNIAESYFLQNGGFPKELTMAHSLHAVGVKYRKLGNFQKAIHYLQDALTIKRTVLSGNQKTIASTLNSLAVANTDPKQSLTYYKESLSIELEFYTENHPHVALSYLGIGGCYHSLGNYQKGLDFKEKALAIQLKALPDNHPNIASSYHSIGGSYHSLGEYQKGLDFEKKALAIRLKTLPDHHPNIASSYLGIGGSYHSLGKYQKGLDFKEKALAIQLKVLPKNHSHIAHSYHSIGGSYHSLGEYQKGLDFKEKALTIRVKTLPENHSDIATSYYSIGNSCHSLGEYQKGLDFEEKALAIRVKTLLENHPDIASSYYSIGNSYHSLGEYQKGLDFKEKALTIRVKTLPENHTDIASSYYRIGISYHSLGEYQKGLDFKEKALAIELKALPENHPDIAASYHTIGDSYHSLGEYQKGLDFKEKALTIRVKTLPDNHPDIASSYYSIGISYHSLGEYQKGLDFKEKALTIELKTLPENHPDIADSYHSIGISYHSLGEYQKGLDFKEKALAIRVKALPDNHPNIASSYHSIGISYYSLDEYQNGLEFEEKALAIRLETLPESHPDIADSYRYIAKLYDKLELAEQALKYEKLAQST